MKRLFGYALLALISTLATACGDGGAEQEGAVDSGVRGPALVMFYTEN